MPIHERRVYAKHFWGDDNRRVENLGELVGKPPRAVLHEASLVLDDPMNAAAWQVIASTVIVVQVRPHVVCGHD